MTVANQDQQEDEYSRLTDGSAKIFGMENFGNTCYCNSVLQCLYYSKPFREAVLEFPPPPPDKPRTRKLQVPGRVPHPFTVDPNAAVLNTSTSQQNNELGLNAVPVPNGTTNSSAPPTPAATKDTKEQSSPASGGSATGFKKMGFFSKLKDDSGSGSSSSHNESSGTMGHIAEQLVSKEPPAYDGLKGLSLGLRFPGQNLPVVGFTEDPFATPEQKKRNALVKGPIINMDNGMSSEYEMNENLFTSLKDIFESMAENGSRIGVVSPSRLIDVLKRDNEPFRSSMHQDAHEFFNFMLNEAIDSVDRQTRQLGLPTEGENAPNRWIHDLFEGLLTSETKCLTCENVSRRDEQFLDLSIDLERNTSVTACLRQFSASEMLCERNKFHCDNCGGLQEAEKRMKVKKLPKILALHLKRFKFTEDMQRNLKLFHRVLYSKHFRLFNTTHDAEDPDKLYELSGVVVHIGGGPYHGHYVSVVKTEHAGWLLFDDEMVESVDPNYVFNFFGDNKGMATAYVLFYQEVSSKDMEKENLFTNEPEVTPPPQAHEAADDLQHETLYEDDHTTAMATPKIDEEEEDTVGQLDETTGNGVPMSRVRTTGGHYGSIKPNASSSSSSSATGGKEADLKRHTSTPTSVRSHADASSSASNTSTSGGAPGGGGASTTRSGSKKDKKRGLSFSFKRKSSS